MSTKSRYTILITTYLEPEHVERLRRVSPRVEPGTPARYSGTIHE